MLPDDGLLRRPAQNHGRRRRSCHSEPGGPGPAAAQIRGVAGTSEERGLANTSSNLGPRPRVRSRPRKAAKRGVLSRVGVQVRRGEGRARDAFVWRCNRHRLRRALRTGSISAEYGRFSTCPRNQDDLLMTFRGSTDTRACAHQTGTRSADGETGDSRIC